MPLADSSGPQKNNNGYRHRYKFRPEYGSEKLLIEFVDGDDPNFVSDLVKALDEINPKINDIYDLWVNDEMTFEVTSKIGEFTLSKSIWGYAFIENGENQEGLKRINSILKADERFESIKVDYDQYRKE